MSRKRKPFGPIKVLRQREDTPIHVDRDGNLEVYNLMVTPKGVPDKPHHLFTNESSGEGSREPSGDSSTALRRQRSLAAEQITRQLQDAPGIRVAGTTRSGAVVLGYELNPMGSPDATPQAARYEDFHRIGKLGRGSSGQVYCVAFTGGPYATGSGAEDREEPDSCSSHELSTPPGDAPPGDGEPGPTWSGKRRAKKYAEKVLQLGCSTDADAIYRELKIIKDRAFVDCPHLVQSYEAFFVDDAVSIIMEFLDCSLHQLLASLPNCRLPPPALQWTLFQVVKALEFLHLPGTPRLHRDIKPANILVNKKGEVKLSDFGLLKQVCSADGATHTFVGTKPYMSPERLLGEDYDSSADIWSLGCVASECAFGRFPFHVSDPSSFPCVLQAVQQPPLPPPPAAATAVPHAYDFLAACLAQRPGDRPTAAALAVHPLFSEPMDGGAKALHRLVRAVAKGERPRGSSS